MSAFAFNKPCLVTNVGGLPEMVGHGQYGMIAEPSDEDSLVNSIDKLLSDREKAERLGKAARETILEKYALIKCLKKQEDLIYSMVR